MQQASIRTNHDDAIYYVFIRPLSAVLNRQQCMKQVDVAVRTPSKHCMHAKHKALWRPCLVCTAAVVTHDCSSDDVISHVCTCQL